MLLALDLLAGLSLLAVALGSARRSPRYCALAFLAAGSWFLAPWAGALVLVHRPLLLHAALAYPTGRLSGWSTGGVVATAWVGALVLPIGLHPLGMLLLGLLAAAAAWIPDRHLPWARPGRDVARHATTALALSLVLPAAGRLVWPGGAGAELLAALYSGLVLLGGLLLLGGLVRLAPHGETDAVLELSESGRGDVMATLREEARASGDTSDRSALLAAADLLAANAALQADLARRVEEVRASRRRLVDTEVTERRRLEAALGGGAGRYLDDLRRTFHQLAHRGDDDVRRLVAVCDAEAAGTQDDLAQLGRGLHPRLLSEAGLAAALADLAARCPVPVHVEAVERRFPEPVEVAVWYACAEALANVVKHARATTATVEVGLAGDEVAACVADDGVGGARSTAGGGIAGLADRLGAVGGRVRLDAAPDGGTRVLIRVPVP